MVITIQQKETERMLVYKLLMNCDIGSYELHDNL